MPFNFIHIFLTDFMSDLNTKPVFVSKKTPPNNRERFNKANC